MAKDTMPTPAAPVQSNPIAKRSQFALPTPMTKESREAIWLGLLEKCPFHVIHAGGVAFTKFTNPPIGNDRDSGLSLRKHTKGDILELTATDVAKILERVGKKVIRIIYEPNLDDEKQKNRLPRAQILNIDNAHYTLDPKDVPLAKYAYLIKVADIKNPLWQHSDKTEPPCLWDSAEDDSKSQAKAS